MENREKKLNSIEKAVKILLTFQESSQSRGIRDLSSELGFSPATVQRILKTLKSYDFVRQDPSTRQYYIGNVFYRFLQALQASNTLTSYARRYMEELASKTRETVHVNIIEGGHRLCIDTIESPRTLKAGMPVGHRSPLHAGGSAKCLLAFSSDEFIREYMAGSDLEAVTDNTITEAKALKEEIARIRKNGYARSLGERTPGLGSLSAPVLDHNGNVQASLSLAVPEIRISDDVYRHDCVRKLMEVAESFSGAMGHGK
ncbi:MAG: IclR family transcriptional regulator [Desulfobacteraceae bacterium]